MTIELATVTGTLWDNSSTDAAPRGDGGVVRFTPVHLDETTHIVHSTRAHQSLVTGGVMEPIRLWPGTWSIRVPDGETFEATLQAGEVYDLAALRGFVAPPGVTVQQVALSGVQVETLPPGAAATGGLSGTEILLGVPAGAPGKDGVDGVDGLSGTQITGVEVEILDADQDGTGAITGTTLSLGIPVPAGVGGLQIRTATVTVPATGWVDDAITVNVAGLAGSAVWVAPADTAAQAAWAAGGWFASADTGQVTITGTAPTVAASIIVTWMPSSSPGLE